MENNAKLGSEEQSKNNVTNNNTTTEQEQEQNRVNLGSANDGSNGDEVGEEAAQRPQTQPSRRTPFTNLSQVDADLALARTLQEQERAYMMLRFGNDRSDYRSWEVGSYLHDDEDDFGDPDDESDGDDEDDDDEEEEEEDGAGVADGMDTLDVHAHDEDAGADDDAGIDVELDPSMFSSDEAYARALQDAEEREMAARLLALAGINEREVEDVEDRGDNSQDAWEEVDPDELSYEELIALGEVVGTESRGLSADTIASLLSVNYKAGNSQNGTNDSCVICRLDYDDGETLIVLSCKHSYHSECINDWLKIKKVCPVCSAEVSTS